MSTQVVDKTQNASPDGDELLHGYMPLELFGSGPPRPECLSRLLRHLQNRPVPELGTRVRPN
jgi:hypothetical protein